MSQTFHHQHIQWMDSTCGCKSCHIACIMLNCLDHFKKREKVDNENIEIFGVFTHSEGFFTIRRFYTTKSNAIHTKQCVCSTKLLQVFHF